MEIEHLRIQGYRIQEYKDTIRICTLTRIKRILMAEHCKAIWYKDTKIFTIFFSKKGFLRRRRQCCQGGGRKMCPPSIPYNFKIHIQVLDCLMQININTNLCSDKAKWKIERIWFHVKKRSWIDCKDKDLGFVD